MQRQLLQELVWGGQWLLHAAWCPGLAESSGSSTRLLEGALVLMGRRDARTRSGKVSSTWALC
jgi:hypothetical protein